MRDAKGKFCKANFKIGDIVEGLGHACPVPYEGRFLGYHPHGEGMIKDPGKGPWYVRRDSIKLVRPAEDDTLAATIRERDEAERMKCELDDMRDTLKECRQEMTENYKNYRKADDRAQAAEAKLADIRSIMRVTALSTNAFDVNSLILKVLDRE